MMTGLWKLGDTQIWPRLGTLLFALVCYLADGGYAYTIIIFCFVLAAI